MAQTVRFVDGVSYTEADQADFNMRIMRPQGIIPESSLGLLAPSAIGSMNVRIGPGEAFIQGFQYINDANVDVPIGANSSGSTRIDIIVLRLNRADNTLLLSTVVGTPGAGAPALTQVVGGTWEFPIATITVPNAAASIVTGNIADARTYSRWPKTALEAVPIQTLLAHYTLATAIDFVPLTQHAWNNFGGSVAFSTNIPGSIVEIDVQGTVFLVNSGGTGSYFGWRLLIDGVTARLMGGDIVPSLATGANHKNVLVGATTAKISGLSVGAHTVQLQVWPDRPSISIYCGDPLTNPIQHLQIQVTETRANLDS
jgi:hypothetical protein